MTLSFEFLQWSSAIGEIFVCYCFLSVIIDDKILKKNILYICFCSSIIGSLLAVNRWKDGSLLSWAMLLFQSVLIFLSLVKKIEKDGRLCFFIIVTYNICLAFFQLLFAFGMLVIFKTQDIRTIYFNNGIYKSLCCVLSIISVSVVYLVCFNYLKTHASGLKSYTWTFFLYDIAGIYMIAWLQTQLLQYGRDRSRESLCFILMILTATFLLMVGSIKSAEKRAELEMLGLQKRLLENNYKEIQNMYQNYACTFHDMKNHLIVLENYCRTGEMEKALGYIEKIQEPIQEFKYDIKSGNEVLDVILNYKLSEAERQGIRTQVIMELENEIGVGGSDLCAILSNLLDNALEACNLIERGGKWIHVIVKRMGDMLLINVSNSFSDKSREDSGHISKKGIHGYGLKSVALTVKKYGGEIEWRGEEGRFVVTITLFNIELNKGD